MKRNDSTASQLNDFTEEDGKKYYQVMMMLLLLLLLLMMMMMMMMMMIGADECVNELFRILNLIIDEIQMIDDDDELFCVYEW
jgi:hypothetical protein